MTRSPPSPQMALQWEVTSTSFAVYAGLLDPCQFAAMAVSAYPLCPSLLTVRNAVRWLEAQHAARAPAAARHGGGSSGNNGSGSGGAIA